METTTTILEVQISMLDAVQRAVKEMWRVCKDLTNGDLQMASANDTIHFLHEEAGEVVKCAMAMGLMGDKTYVRSEATESKDFNWETLLEEIGDTILMALTLAQAFDVRASTCLDLSIHKFYARAERRHRDNLHVPYGPISAHPNTLIGDERP